MQIFVLARFFQFLTRFHIYAVLYIPLTRQGGVVLLEAVALNVIDFWIQSFRNVYTQCVNLIKISHTSELVQGHIRYGLLQGRNQMYTIADKIPFIL